MQHKLLTTSLLGLSLTALLFTSRSLATPPGNPFAITHFSATMNVTSNGHTAISKVFRSGDKMRSDMAHMGSGAYMIYQLNTGAMFIVTHGRCMAMPPRGNGSVNPFAFNGQVQRQEIGTATVDGHPTKIEQVTVTPAHGTAATMKVWAATDLDGFPLRIEMANGAVITYTDVSLATPDDALFAQPDNCMTMPGMPGGF